MPAPAWVPGRRDGFRGEVAWDNAIRLGFVAAAGERGPWGWVCVFVWPFVAVFMAVAGCVADDVGPINTLRAAGLDRFDLSRFVGRVELP